MFEMFGKAVMLKKYLWGAIVPALAVFVLSGAGARPKPDTLLKNNADTVTYQSIMIKQTTKDTSLRFAGSNGRIIGIVVDQENREPIPGVNITIVGTNFNAKTDSAGMYTIVNVPIGLYAVEAKYKGYETQKITGIKAITGLATKVNFKFKITIVEKKGTVRQTAKDSIIASTTGKITGVVIDVKTREAISGASVTLLGLNMCDSTNLDGRYAITNVPEGRYNVQAKITGYEPQVIVAKTKIRQIVPVNFVLKPTIIGTKDSGIVKPSERRTTTETEHRSITTEEIERMEKPNIYLYPTKQETLTVKVHPKGKITTSIPEYNTGWNVVVAPGGKINDTYDFLFYEATVDYNFTIDA
ncbi:MAG: carboxypeptidase regulatory-like domain-containing protein, partial [bacterium]|nr:carboxypeptidase regulatory-like domain-containing protein [bacterium]